MMIEKPVLNKLKEFGLNTYEAKLWTALLSRGVSTAGELSDIANVPRSRSYDVLESLEKKGFVLMKPSKPIKYVAVPPEEVLDRVKKKIQDESQQQVKLINDLKTGSIINELNSLHSQGLDLVEPIDLSGTIRDQSNIHNHLEARIKNAKVSVEIMTTSKGLSNQLSIMGHALKKSKAKIRILAPIDQDNQEAAKEFSKYAEIKHTATKARFCVIDGKEILFMLLDDEKVHPSYDLAIWVNTDFFSKTLISLFDTEWKSSKPLGL